MDEAMGSYMDMYGIEVWWSTKLWNRDPTMFEDFLELHGWYEILKEVREKIPKRFADPKTLWWPWERTPEQTKEAIEWMRKRPPDDSKLLWNRPHPIPPENILMRLRIRRRMKMARDRSEKTFGDQKKLGIPAFQKKDVYKEIDESFNGMLDQQMQYKKNLVVGLLTEVLSHEYKTTYTTNTHNTKHT